MRNLGKSRELVESTVAPSGPCGSWALGEPKAVIFLWVQTFVVAWSCGPDEEKCFVVRWYLKSIDFHVQSYWLM